MTTPRPAAAGLLAAERPRALVPLFRSRSRRAGGLLALAGVLSASCVLSTSPARPAQAAPAATQSRSEHQVVRPDGDVPAFGVSTPGSAAAALDDPVTQPAAPDAATLVAGRAGASTTVTLGTAALGGRKVSSAEAWYSAATGEGTRLRVEVLWRGKVRSSTTTAAGKQLAWRSVRFAPKGQSDLDDISLRFTAVGGQGAEVRAAYANVTRKGAGPLVLRPDGDVPTLQVRPAGSAWQALDDDVTSSDAVTGADDVNATRVGQSTTITLASPPPGGQLAKSRAWFYGSTGASTRLQVEVVWDGAAHAAVTVAPSSDKRWRSISFTPPSAAAARDLQLRFTATGGKKATVQAAYADLVTTHDDRAEVNSYLAGLEKVDPGAEAGPHSVGDPVAEPDSEPLPDASAPSGQSRYACTSTPYSLSATPKQMVTFNPDANKLWLGGMLQGQGYAQGLGSLRELPIRKRAPLKIFIDLKGKDVSTTVASPDPSTVAQGVSDLVNRVRSEHVPVPAKMVFRTQEEHSTSQAMLELGLSAKYLGASAEAKLKTNRNAQQSTVMASFFQQMYTVSAVTPETPADYFGSDFTTGDLEEQERQGRVARDNPPVVVGDITYGRTLLYTVTSSASTKEIEGAIDASWSGGAASGSVHLTARQQEILGSATYGVAVIGGDDESARYLIRDRQLGDYFSRSADLATAVPISYQVDNIADGSAARFTETSSYDLTECRAKANRADVVGATVRLSRPSFYLEKGQSPAKLYGSLTVNGSTQWSRGRDNPQEVGLHNLTDPDPWQGSPDAAPWVVDVGNGQQLSLDGSVNRRTEWWEVGADPSNQYRWRWTQGADPYGEVSAAGGSSHSPVSLRFRVSKVADIVKWTP